MIIYTINKEKHSSGIHIPELTFKDSISAVVRFNETARYRTECICHQEDINKLFGLSESWAYHMNYSVRFGWRYVPKESNKIEILGFVHNKGVMSWSPITRVEIGKPYYYSLRIEKDKYIFIVGNDMIEFPRKINRGTKGLKYKLYPYFGGTEVAPQTITIEFAKKI